MENKDNAKDNVLKEVNKKLKRKGIKIAVISAGICIVIGIILYFLLFVKQTPISADLFKNVRIETKLETINQLDDRELPYNHLIFTININQSSFYQNRYFYIQNDDTNNTSTLYFYMSENYIQKSKNNNLEGIHKGESIDASILLYPDLCKTDKINEITKVYYLVYDYDKFNQQDFDKVKNQAVLLWEK